MFLSDFMCVSCSTNRRDGAAAVRWASDWSLVASSGELCEHWCSLTVAFSWKASLLGGLQVFNMLIYTSKQLRKGIVLKGGEVGLQKEGEQGNEGCFIFSPPPLRPGQGFNSMREAH